MLRRLVWQCTNCRRAGRPASEARWASTPHLQFPWLSLLRSGRSQLGEVPLTRAGIQKPSVISLVAGPIRPPADLVL